MGAGVGVTAGRAKGGHGTPSDLPGAGDRLETALDSEPAFVVRVIASARSGWRCGCSPRCSRPSAARD